MKIIKYSDTAQRNIEQTEWVTYINIVTNNYYCNNKKKIFIDIPCLQ